MSATKTSAAGLRLLTLMEALCGYAAAGASNAELAEAIRTTPPNVTRQMATLIAKGWARKDETTGRFFPTARFGALAIHMLDDVERMTTRIDDFTRSMTGEYDIERAKGRAAYLKRSLTAAG
jgi:DNA-binding IclR family transcriptional regulator